MLTSESPPLVILQGKSADKPPVRWEFNYDLNHCEVSNLDTGREPTRHAPFFWTSPGSWAEMIPTIVYPRLPTQLISGTTERA
jgi:hypothetical protein